MDYDEWQALLEGSGSVYVWPVGPRLVRRPTADKARTDSPQQSESVSSSRGPTATAQQRPEPEGD